MLSYEMSFILLGILTVCLKYILNHYHLLISLLSLEFISLSLCCLILTYSISLYLESYFILYFLVMVVCEGVLGLSLLVGLSFYFSVDYMKSFNSLSC